MRVLFHGVLTYVDTFLPKSGIILPQIVEISSPDVEISPSLSLFRNFTNFFVNQDLIYPHPIDCHKISSIDNPCNAFYDEGTKRHGTGKNINRGQTADGTRWNIYLAVSVFDVNVLTIKSCLYFVNSKYEMYTVY